jgi:AraC family transcriptional regulator
MQAHVRTLFGSGLMRIVDWQCTGHAPEPFGGEEWNDAYEVVVVRRGAFVRRVAGRDVFLDPGTVAFTHADESYQVRHPVAGGDACSAFRLAGATAAELATGADPDSADLDHIRFPALAAPLDGRAFLLHRIALRAALSPGVAALEVEEHAATFLRAAVAASSGSGREGQRGRLPRPHRPGSEYVVRVREVIGRRYREPLTLSDIAREVGCSPFHLHRLVRAEAGVPIHRLVLRLRLREALERLLDTRDGISAIAYAAGFASHSHLTDAFRREYGAAPSAVRRLAACDLRPLRERARIR